LKERENGEEDEEEELSSY